MKNGKSSSAASNPVALAVDVGRSFMIVLLEGGGRVRVPWSVTKRLARASQRDRECLSIEANGAGLWWPSLDEDLSVRGLVRDYAKSRTSLSRTPGTRRAATSA